jgi:ring-1,2-phenylacetyl-CoA epoxidase subunit PaaE
VCCTCRAKLLEGQVRMDRNFALDPADLAAGFVLTCQSHPTTPRVVLSFDER